VNRDGGPKLLVTGFGPFPGAPENPTERLMDRLSGEAPESFGAGALRMLVLPTDYRRSWAMLRRHYARFDPDIVVHFGLSRRAEALHVERRATRRCSADRPDAAGYSPPSGAIRRSGPEELAATLPVDAMVGALNEAGYPAVLSDDAGDYVCNATLYRSLLAAAAGQARLVGFIHVPPIDGTAWSVDRLVGAGEIVLRAACAGWHGHTGRLRAAAAGDNEAAAPSRLA